METIADRLRALRAKKGVSQDVVAEACDLSRVALTRYECGARVPIAGNVAKLASYYGVTVDYLMGVETQPAQAETPPASTGGEQDEYAIMPRGGYAMDRYHRLSLEDKQVVNDMINRLFELAFGKE